MSDQPHARENTRVDRILLTAIEQFTEEGTKTEEIMGRTLDISTGGVKIELKRPLPLLSTVKVSLGFKDDVVHFSGQVVHLKINDDQMIETGIQFMGLSDDDLKLLEANL
jgi:c-di-GMP-binding flagellar brake protein YcgR